MARKQFAEGIDAILGGADASNKEKNYQSVSEKEKKNVEAEARTTIILKKDLLEKLKAIAFWERSQIKEVVTTAIEQYICSKEESLVNEALENFRTRKKS